MHVNPPAGRRSTSLTRRRAGLAVLLVVFALLAARGAVRNGNDFESYHRSGAWFLEGRDLYAFGDLMPYRYVPGVAALFAPLASLSFPAARALWAVLTAALAFGVALCLDRTVGPRRALAVPLAWLCLVQPLFQELSHGQVDVLVLALALAAFEAEDRGRGVAAGVLVALAAALKASPLVLALDWALRRRWRPLAGVALGAAVLAVVPVFTYGLAGAFEQHLHFLGLNAADIQTRRGEPANQSLWAMAHVLGLGAAGGAVACLALLATLASTKELAWRRLLLLASVPLLSGYGWPQGFLVAVPLLAELLAGPPAIAGVAGALAAGVSLLSYDVVGMRGEAWAHRHRALGLLLLALVLVGRAAAPALARWRAGRAAPGAPLSVA